jgi:hypothetical protein
MSVSMAILIKGTCVVIRDKTIRAKYEGGLESFRMTIPNGTYCFDGELHSVGFLFPFEVEQYIASLQRNGLTFLADGHFEDIAIADMLTGITFPCTWLALTRNQPSETADEESIQVSLVL